MTQPLITLLAIGGSDPCGGAGIQADIKAGSSLGVHVLTAVTTVTAQNSYKFDNSYPIPPEILEQQLGAVLEEVIPDAVKIGMLGSLENGEVISRFIKKLPDSVPIVVDPVLKASVGELSSDSSFEYILNFYESMILPYADAVTPNIPEADIFLKFNRLETIKDDMEKAAALLKLWKTNAVILKGGHSEGDEISDYLADYLDGVVIISKSSHKKIPCLNLHGTGCVYASLLAAFLSLGFPLHEAFLKTSERLHEIITESCNYSLGNSKYGPLNILRYRL